MTFSDIARRKIVAAARKIQSAAWLEAILHPPQAKGHRMTRPVYQRKYDRLTWGGRTTPDELAIDYAIAPFDRMSRDMDRKWGIDVLASLVSPEMAARYGRTLASLNAAIDAVDRDRAVDRASACMRGMDAMDAEAAAAGHTPPTPVVTIAEADGFRIGILGDDRLWERAQEDYPGLALYSLRQIALMAKDAAAASPFVAAVLEEFPGAAVTAIKKKRSPMIEDEIPDWSEVDWSEESVPF